MNQYSILFIDDDPDDHLFVRGAFDDFGLSTNLTSLYDGQQAIKYLEVENSKTAFRKFPDLIICDINMPFMNGIKFLETVKSSDAYRHIPVCMLTTSCDEPTKTKLLKLGALDCVIKPVYSSNYRTILADILNKTPAFNNLH